MVALYGFGFGICLGVLLVNVALIWQAWPVCFASLVAVSAVSLSGSVIKLCTNFLNFDLYYIRL